jgi:hypothetical protein
MFDSWMLRRVFETKQGETMGDWRKLHNAELHNFKPNS